MATQDDDRQQDASGRAKYEKDIKKKLNELHGVKERLYTLRFDTSVPREDIARDVENLAREYNRIEEDIQILRKKELSSFQKSLNLSEIGLDPLLTKTRGLNNSQSSDSVGTSESVPLNINTSRVVEHDTMTEEELRENEKLMRTRSTQSMKNLNAQQKWQGLFKMFKEWKYQTNVANASRMLENSTPVEEEIDQLRAAIHVLRQRKNLNRSDQALLENLTIKLRGLTKISADMNHAARSDGPTKRSTMPRMKDSDSEDEN